MIMDMHVINPIVPLFLLKTFSILENADPEIVTWSEEGDSFIVIDPDRFGAEVIPCYFKHNKFSSFVRQLNFYGFRKVKGKLNFIGMSEQHSWEFKHPYFLKGQPDMLSEIRRMAPPADETSNSGEQVQSSSDGESETVEQLRRHVAKLTNKLQVLSKSVEDMQVTIANYQDGIPVLESESVTTNESTETCCDCVPSVVMDTDLPAIDWGIGDDELLMTFLGDLNEPSTCLSGPCSDCEALEKPSLKRGRSVDDIWDILHEPSRQAAKTSVSSDISIERSANFTDSLVVQAVANALALNESSEATEAFDQYVTAVAAILSCAGMPQAQALATSSAVLSRAQMTLITNQSDGLSLSTTSGRGLISI